MRLTLKHITAICLITFCIPLHSEERSGQMIDMAQPVVATVGNIEFRECIVEAESRDRTMQCAWHEVPENYSQPDGEKIRLFIARIPAKKSNKALEPMLLLAGGPGQAASEAYLHWDKIFADLAKERDFYLIDQRGTGHSNYLGCENTKSDESLLLGQTDPELVKELTLQCLKELPGDPRFYTTSVAISDFERVRNALDIQRWNLFGVSYGTRVAIHYLRRHPASIRSAILDSTVPPNHVLGSEVAFRSQNILDHLYERCRRNDECNTRFPDLEKEVNTLFSQLKKSPVEIHAENFSTGEMEDITFTHDYLVMLVRLYLYHTQSSALLPPMLHEATANDNFAPMARATISVTSTMNEQLSPGMHNAVTCTEDIPFFEDDKTLQKKNADSYMGVEFLNNFRAACSVWPRGVMDEDFKQPLESDLPVLLFSGEYDPITPPEYAEEILKGLSNAKHLVLKGYGHSVSIEGCAPYIVETFVNNAGVEGLNTSCLDRLNEAPLFVNFNGPLP